MKSGKECEALIHEYIKLDDERRKLKKWYEAPQPIDEECKRAWAACVEAFDGDQTAASNALYKIHGGRQAPGTPVAPDAPPPPRRVRSGGRGAAVRDPRIPPVGTTIYKKDRYGKTLAEAVVREDGIVYAGKVYKSPSAAGLAASIAIGGAKTAVDGYAFWGLK